MPSYSYQLISKEEVCKFFLNQALHFYNKHETLFYLSSINMAGIAEEILGKLIEKQGKDNAQALEIKTFKTVRQILDLEPMEDSDIRDNLLNKAKNVTKHGSGDLYLDPKSEAESILERAIKNYQIYYADETEDMDSFLKCRYVENQEFIKRVTTYKAI